MFRHLSDFHDWFAERQRANSYRVTRAPLPDLPQWVVDTDTGNLRHRSGGFFTVEGFRVATNRREVTAWQQPIIIQPEVGILGILAKVVNGETYCLMQAKMEPGNLNLVQMAPTVQATRSNYTQVHRGNRVPYLEHFIAPHRGRHGVLFDALQSEQGSWFLGKRNRNMILLVEEDIDPLEDFCWLSLSQIAQLLRTDHLISMDSRTVLSGMASDLPETRPPLHNLAQVLSWFTEAKVTHELHRERVPLNAVDGWTEYGDVVSHDKELFFDIIGVDVEASNREVGSWSQPMLAPRGHGIAAFLTRRIDGVLHVLVRAMTEAGTSDVVELGPTVQGNPDNYPGMRLPFLDEVLTAPPERIRWDVRLSEEGGRFYHAETRYMMVEAGNEVPAVAPDGFMWLSVGQLAELVRYHNYVNVEARTLLCCLHADHWADRSKLVRSGA